MRRTALSIIIAFSISISILLLFDEYFSYPKVFDIEDDQFFSRQIEPQKEIYSIGGSGVVQLNSTLIDTKIKQKYPDYTFYNLAYNADTPELRYNSIDEVISMKPKLVIYGLSYYDLNGFYFLNKSEEKNVLPNLRNIIEDTISLEKNQFDQFNPKENTLNFIKNNFENSIFEASDKLTLFNSPFSNFSNEQFLIKSNQDLKNINPEIVSSHVKQDVLEQNKQINYLKKILKSFNEQNVKIIFLILPIHDTYNNLIPDLDKKLFYTELESLEKNFQFKIYDLSERYSDLEIWQDHVHIAYDKNSMIYSNDVFDIIILELDDVI